MKPFGVQLEVYDKDSEIYVLVEPEFFNEKLMKPILVKKNDDGCWVVISHHLNCQTSGYPMVSRGKYIGAKTSKIGAHRYVYWLKTGQINYGMSKVVRHKCDNPLCINPEHLEIGTQQDNMEDMKSRGRHRKVYKFHLSAEDVLKIKRLLKENPDLTFREIANMFGVTDETISKIAHGKTWAHIDPNIPDELFPYTLPMRPKLYQALNKTPEEIKEIVTFLYNGGTPEQASEKFNIELKHAKRLDIARNEGEFGEALRLKKRVWLKGPDHPSSKLTHEDVEKIKSLFDQGYTTREIANMFSVSQEPIKRIKREWRNQR